MICPHCGKHIDKIREQEYSRQAKPKTDSKNIVISFILELNPVDKKAVLVSDTVGKMWIPRSQIKSGLANAKQGEPVDLKITKWIAKQKGLIGDGPKDYIDDDWKPSYPSSNSDSEPPPHTDDDIPPME